MKYTMLSEITSRLFDTAVKSKSSSFLDAPDEDIPVASALLVSRRSGIPLEMFGENDMALTNVAAMSLLFARRERRQVITHEITGGVSRLIREADLRSIPAEPPLLMRGPWIMESKRLQDPLFGSVVCLGGYPLQDRIFLVSFFYPDGLHVGRVVPQWKEGEIEIPEDYSFLIEDRDRDGHGVWLGEAFRYSLMLSIFLEAEKTPVVAAVNKKSAPGRNSPKHTCTVPADGPLTKYTCQKSTSGPLLLPPVKAGRVRQKTIRAKRLLLSPKCGGTSKELPAGKAVRRENGYGLTLTKPGAGYLPGSRSIHRSKEQAIKTGVMPSSPSKESELSDHVLRA